MERSQEWRCGSSTVFVELVEHAGCGQHVPGPHHQCCSCVGERANGCIGNLQRVTDGETNGMSASPHTFTTAADAPNQSGAVRSTAAAHKPAPGRMPGPLPRL